MITVLMITFLSLIGFFTLYLSVLTLLGFFYKDKSGTIADTYQKQNNYKNSFSILVPAHNEESVIGPTVKNLLAINYPENLFQVIVIADNCSDKTFVNATKAGVVVIERENMKIKGKGYALKWCFELLLKSRKQFDALLVIDADTIVSDNILRVLNYYLNEGCKAIQCSDLVKPNPGAWSAEITRVGLYLYNYVRPLGRKILGFSAGLRGNGMCFKADLLEKIPWQAYSQTEDLEYGMNLLLKGIPVTFAPEAKVFAVMPTNPKNAESQRARWEAGRIPLIKKYSLMLIVETIRKRSFRILDSFVELVTPAFVNLFLLTILMLVASTGLKLLKILPGNIYLVLWILILLLQLFYVLGGLSLCKADVNAYKALWKAPKYIIWKIILYIKLFIKGHTKLWVRTAREGS
jgi:cellulose synthase/poly-beta-1,6-N-acetylglucosamine synthase-like glycosyltransferase